MLGASLLLEKFSGVTQEQPAELGLGCLSFPCRVLGLGGDTAHVWHFFMGGHRPPTPASFSCSLMGRRNRSCSTKQTAAACTAFYSCPGGIMVRRLSNPSLLVEIRYDHIILLKNSYWGCNSILWSFSGLLPISLGHGTCV